MKRLLLFGLLLALVAPAGDAQTPQALSRMTMAVAWDLDGEAADADQVLTAANGVLADSTDYTALITAQPDSCRLIDITVNDVANITAGTLTIAGTDCLGKTKSCAFAFTVADDDGVKTLTCTDGFGAYLASITAISTGALTGEGGADTATVGYTSDSVNGWPIYGKVMPPFPTGAWGVDPTKAFDVLYKVTTSGSLSTTVTGVTGAEDALNSVSVGDLLIFELSGTSYERKVTAKASADSVTVNQAILIPAAGVTYRYKRFYFTTNPQDFVYIPVSGWRTALFNWSVDANANTGGVVMLLSCTSDRAEFPSGRWVQVQTTTVASAGTQSNTTESLDLELIPYTWCRMGFRFGTGDDADVAAEDINLSVDLMK